MNSKLVAVSYAALWGISLLPLSGAVNDVALSSQLPLSFFWYFLTGSVFTLLTVATITFDGGS